MEPEQVRATWAPPVTCSETLDGQVELGLETGGDSGATGTIGDGMGPPISSCAGVVAAVLPASVWPTDAPSMSPLRRPNAIPSDARLADATSNPLFIVSPK